MCIERRILHVLKVWSIYRDDGPCVKILSIYRKMVIVQRNFFFNDSVVFQSSRLLSYIHPEI